MHCLWWNKFSINQNYLRLTSSLGLLNYPWNLDLDWITSKSTLLLTYWKYYKCAIFETNRVRPRQVRLRRTVEPPIIRDKKYWQDEQRQQQPNNLHWWIWPIQPNRSYNSSNYAKRQPAPIENEYHQHRFQNPNYNQQRPSDDLLKSQQQQLQPYSRNI